VKSCYSEAGRRVCFPSSRGVSQEEVQKKPQLCEGPPDCSELVLCKFKPGEAFGKDTRSSESLAFVSLARIGEQRQAARSTYPEIRLDTHAALPVDCLDLRIHLWIRFLQITTIWCRATHKCAVRTGKKCLIVVSHSAVTYVRDRSHKPIS
jgi:hypothetical protein